MLPSVTRSTVQHIIRENIAPDSKLSTDTAAYYKRGKLGVAEHGMVNHFAEEYVRGDVHVNTLEGYFSIFKRGMKGVYQHCSEKHLHRYLAEFDFRYNRRCHNCRCVCQVYNRPLSQEGPPLAARACLIHLVRPGVNPIISACRGPRPPRQGSFAILVHSALF
jgi:hypothetical protein